MAKLGLFKRAHSKVEGEKRTLRERGASMVEFALVAPLFFAVIFGGIEVGLMFRTYLGVENLSRSAARIASIERDNLGADDLILTRIATQAGPLQGDVTRIVIFNAPTLDSEVPAGCANGVPLAGCNTYTVIDGDVLAQLGSGGGGGFAPNTRRPGQDNVGIYIEVEYQFATGFFDTLTLSTTTVEVIEQDV